jgi:coatomer protein complex subunit epsilon
MFGSGLMKMQLVIDEINDSAASALQAVKLLALYLSGGEQKVCSSSVT